MKALAAWKFSFTIPALFIFTNTKIVFDYKCEYDITEFNVFIFRSNVSYCPASWLSENSSKDTGSFQWKPVQN